MRSCRFVTAASIDRPDFRQLASTMMFCMTPERAAMAVAARFGISVGEPVRLSDSNNVVLWLRPAAVVAEVATGHHRRLEMELIVAQHLLQKGAPVVPTAAAAPKEVHRVDDLENDALDLCSSPGSAAAGRDEGLLSE